MNNTCISHCYTLHIWTMGCHFAAWAVQSGPPMVRSAGQNNTKAKPKFFLQLHMCKIVDFVK